MYNCGFTAYFSATFFVMTNGEKIHMKLIIVILMHFTCAISIRASILQNCMCNDVLDCVSCIFALVVFVCVSFCFIRLGLYETSFFHDMLLLIKHTYSHK